MTGRAARRRGLVILGAIGLLLATLVLVDSLNGSRAGWLDVHQLPPLATARRDLPRPLTPAKFGPPTGLVLARGPVVAGPGQQLFLALALGFACVVLRWWAFSLARRGPPAGRRARAYPLAA